MNPCSSPALNSLLQWGHAFVSVETGLGEGLCPKPAWASMGPCFCKRGNAPGGVQLALARRASMGPRFCKRGNSTITTRHYWATRASMGPRFCKRGNDNIIAIMQADFEQLQWGHAFVSVETLNVAYQLHGIHAASMGPRFCKRGNWTTDFLSTLTKSCFNGATLL